MKVRPKLFLLIFAIAFASLLLLSALSYWQSARAIEASLRDELRRVADGLALRINSGLGERETDLVKLAQAGVLGEYLKDFGPLPHTAATQAPESPPSTELPEALRATLATFLTQNEEYYSSIAALTYDRPVFRVVITSPSASERKATTVSFQTQNLPSNNSGPDSIGGYNYFLSLRDGTPFRALIERGPFGPTLRFTVPILDAPNEYVIGALVVDLKLDQLFEQANDMEKGGVTGLQTSRVVAVVHQAGRIYYHSNEALKYQPINSAMPNFKPVADVMASESAGVMFYNSANDRWLAAYRPLGQFELSLAVASDYSAALQPVRRSLTLNIFFSVLIALIAALGLTLIAQRRSGSLARLAQGAAAIARGELDQKLVVSSAENQPLADSMNAVTMRLREQLAREAESRQFDSFMRLSAMLTHDLKNAISSLSLLVTNMDRQFDNAEFRADAMSSLKEATEKLQRLVTKLSEPVKTMSGEHQRPSPTNLVPIIRRVLTSVAKAAPQSHDTEIDLPEELVALADAERIEKVIENLVINALEAMGPEKGALKIAGAAAGQGRVCFSISDSGTGITRDFQERRLFRPFATTKQGGVGLGLYTCREVIRAHGGSIEVDSEPGVGTTFRVVLPSGKTGEQ